MPLQASSPLKKSVSLILLPFIGKSFDQMPMKLRFSFSCFSAFFAQGGGQRTANEAKGMLEIVEYLPSA